MRKKEKVLGKCSILLQILISQFRLKTRNLKLPSKSSKLLLKSMEHMQMEASVWFEQHRTIKLNLWSFFAYFGKTLTTSSAKMNLRQSGSLDSSLISL